MKIKIITPNQYGRIEFSKEELEKILGEAYDEGYADGKVYQINRSVYDQINRGVHVNDLISCTTPYVIDSCTGDTEFVTGLTSIISNSNTNVDATLAATTTAELDLK